MGEGDGWLLRREAAVYLRLSVSALAHMASDGRGPRYYRAGKLVRYRKSDLDEWAGFQAHDPMPTHVQEFVQAAGGMSNIRRKLKRFNGQRRAD